VLLIWVSVLDSVVVVRVVSLVRLVDDDVALSVWVVAVEVVEVVAVVNVGVALVAVVVLLVAEALDAEVLVAEALVADAVVADVLVNDVLVSEVVVADVPVSEVLVEEALVSEVLVAVIVVAVVMYTGTIVQAVVSSLEELISSIVELHNLHAHDVQPHEWMKLQVGSRLHVVLASSSEYTRWALQRPSHATFATRGPSTKGTQASAAFLGTFVQA
jgi:hypothetical protein